jgi:hypothetical protein
MKTNAENRFREGIDLSFNGEMFKSFEAVEYDLKPLIELEVTMFDIPVEIFYRINNDNYIQFIDYHTSKTPIIFAQYKRTSASLRENLKAILQEYVEFSTLFNGQARFLKSGFLTEFDYKQIISDIKEKHIKKELEARKNETPLIKYISSLDLELMPKGDDPNNWISKCPNGRKHFLMISTLNDEWGCGYCKKKGKLNDLKKWVDEIEGNASNTKKFNPHKQNR